MYYEPDDRRVLDIQNQELLEPDLREVPLEFIDDTQERILKLK